MCVIVGHGWSRIGARLESTIVEHWQCQVQDPTVSAIGEVRLAGDAACESPLTESEGHDVETRFVQANSPDPDPAAPLPVRQNPLRTSFGAVLFGAWLSHASSGLRARSRSFCAK